jgi:hypothetical protein
MNLDELHGYMANVVIEATKVRFDNFCCMLKQPNMAKKSLEA